MDGFLVFVAFIGFVALVVGLFWGIIRNAKKQTGKRQYLWALCGLIAFVAFMSIDSALYPVKDQTAIAKAAPASASHAISTQTKPRAIAQKTKPHAMPHHTAAPERKTAAPPTIDRKAQFLAGVDESISISDVSGGPYKYIGDKVDLHGVVGHIVDQNTFNIADDSGDTVVVIGADTSSLQAGQAVRVVGQVSQPIQGTNLAGGSENFAAVTEYYMQCSGGSLDVQC